jgi:hypothetical protein
MRNGTLTVSQEITWGPLSGRRAMLVDLPVVHDIRGNLTAIEAGTHTPFDIKRTYHLYDVPGGSERGGHAHRRLEQLIIAMSGSFDITLTNGTDSQTFHLNRSYYGLYVPPMHWRVIDNFSSGAVCLVLASDHYDESDYYRTLPEFLANLG